VRLAAARLAVSEHGTIDTVHDGAHYLGTDRAVQFLRCGVFAEYPIHLERVILSSRCENEVALMILRRVQS